MTEVFRNIFYFAKRFKVPSYLNLLGLVVAFSSFYLMMSQIIYQVTYNHDVDDYKLILSFYQSLGQPASSGICVRDQLCLR